MKTTRLQKIIAVMLSALLLVTAAPVAVFAEGEAVTGDYYQLITDVSQMVGGARYLIASAWECLVLDGSLGENMDSPNNHIEVDVDGDKIAATAELDAAAFEIDPGAGTIRSVSGYYIGSHNSQNKLLTSTTSDFENQIGFDDGDFVIGHQGTANHFSLHFNNDSGQKRFRFFKNDGQDPIALYMRVDAPVSYVNAQGEAQEPIADYTTLDKSVTEWTNGWYVLKNDVTYPGRIAVKGDNVNLILCDGATLNANKGIFIREGYSLTIWAQKNGTGALIAKGNTQGSYESAGIGASPECGGQWIDSYTYDNYDAGDLTVNGGVIIATGAWHCAGIGSSVGRNYGTITINGGTVTATGGEGAAGIGGAYSTSGNVIVINGGTVTATGGDHGAGIGGGENFGGDTITINGGNVTAVGGYYGAGIGGGRKGGSGEITVGGGTIQAQGGKYGAGIGNGNSGEYGHITFNGGIVNASRGEGIVAAGIGGKDCYIRFNYTEPGYDMRITTDSNYEGHAALFDKPFISVGLSKTRTYNGYTATRTISDTIIPKTAGIWDVTFDKNGGTGSMQSEEVPGGTYTLPACIFTAPSAEEPFICWAVKVGDADPVVKQPGDTVLVNADTTVTAIWKTDYTISFDNGGGSGTMDSAAINAYDTYTLPENGFTAPAGKHFFAWEISAGDSSANIMQPGEELLVTGNVTARALWTVSITSWAELQTAIDNAQDGDTVALGQSLTAQSSDLRLLVSGKAITLDLNGYTLDRAQNAASLLGGVFTVAPGASLTVCDSGAGGTGTIKGGYAEKGGAFYNEGTLIIVGGAITDNHVSHENNANRGGAIYNKGTLIIKNCTISGNDGDDGGAIFNTADGSAVLKNVTITNNISVNHGGGAIVNYGALALQSCTVTGNTSKSNGGAIWTNAGGSAVTITNTTITNNATSNDDTCGGAIYIESGSVAVTGGKIADNTAKDGGAVFNNASGTLNLTDVFVHSNKSTQRGGGSITNYGTATLTDCDVWDNEAKTNGGAIWTGGAQADVTLTNCVVTGNTAELTGGGICLYQGTLTASGTTVSNNQSAGGAGMYIYEGGSAILGGDGNLFYWNESSANGGGIANKGDLRISSLFNAQENRAAGYGGGVWNSGSMSVKDTVIIRENSAGLLGKDVYLPEGKVVALSGELNFSTIGVDAETPDQFITSGWYDWQRNASPESVFKAPEYHAVYMPDGATELKLKKTDDYPYNAEATVWAETSDRSTYQVGVDYTIRNLTSGNSRRFDGSLVSVYGTYDGITRYTRQGASSSGVAGSSVAALEIDRSKLDTIQETGVFMEFTPFFYTTGGKFRCGVELFPYSLDPPPHLGDVNNNVGENAYNTITLTGSKNGSYTYQLRYGSADGALRCAATCDGDFSADAAAQAGTETQTWGPYRWYLTGDAPAPGESVKLRIAAICCAAGFKMESLQVTTPMYMLSEWTDVTVTGTCSHSNGHLQAVAANEPTCTQSGNSAYWKCDICGKCFSDAAAENEITEDSTVIPANGHTYAEPSAGDWTWTKSGDTYTAAVTVTCQNSDDVQTLTATVEKTAAADGTAIYTATATVGEGDDVQTFSAVMPTVYHSVTGYEDATGNTVTADKATAAEGQTVTLTAAPTAGYGLKALTVTSGEDGVGLTAGTDGTFTFTMPDGDLTVTAEFDRNYTVAIVTDGHGTVTVDNPLAFEGDTVTLTVAPGTNYALDTLTVTDADGEEIEVTDNTFAMPAKDVTVTSRFYETYKIRVGGVQVTSKNKADVLGDGSVVYEGDQTEGTLYLTDANITGAYYEGSIAKNIFVNNADLSLTITLSGENSVSGGHYAFDIACAGVTLTGEGLLNAHASSEAFYFHRTPLTIDTTTVNAEADNSFCMEIGSAALTIRDSSVTAVGGGNMALDAKDVTIVNSTVDATAGYSYAIYGSDSIRMTDSTVTATSKNQYAVYAGYKEMTITSSVVTASSEGSEGIYVKRSLTVTDSTVETTGWYQGLTVDGALTLEGDTELTVNGRNRRYAALLVGRLEMDDDFVITTPENAVVANYYGDAYDTVWEADGTTLADKVVIRRAYHVSVNDAEHGTVTADKASAFKGDTVAVTATPADGYTLASLTVETGSGESVTVTDGAFVMPREDVVITAAFACPHASYTLTGWSWAEDYSSATATFACGACGDEQNVPGTVTEVEVSAATATADKVVKYTASLTFNGKTYTTETGNVTLPGTATGEPDTPPTEPIDPDTPTGSNICKWDNMDHGTSIWGRLVKFFHSILYFFAHLFGRR
ncbi:MAG: right-handed parallel beta-helix repeat-containing protein [Clostridia bacterium]|nr:right-handed parallel beta-helix repeat-containing protein [Clostridia bacterium]